MKVSNMTSPNGNPAPNQFITEDVAIIYQDSDGLIKEAHLGQMFQSYESNIVFIPNFSGDDQADKILIDRIYWDYSRTIGKYRNMFLGETKKETQEKIDSGEYKLVNLN